jgi:hypothetical protein
VFENTTSLIRLLLGGNIIPPSFNLFIKDLVGVLRLTANKNESTNLYSQVPVSALGLATLGVGNCGCIFG